jgi:NADH:ubiquinone oxidoreductase subunit K
VMPSNNLMLNNYLIILVNQETLFHSIKATVVAFFI